MITVAYIVALVFGWKFAIKESKKPYSEALFVAGALTTFSGIAYFIVVPMFFYEGLLHVIAPEFKAIEFFISLAR